MNLDIIARLVQILRDAPELGAIEVRRGLFGAWSAVRVSRSGHPSHSGDHVVVSPFFRFHHQSEADFYAPQFVGDPFFPDGVNWDDQGFPGGGSAPPFPESYSSDYRLSRLDTYTYGLSVTVKIKDRVSLDAAYKRYVMEGRDGVTSFLDKRKPAWIAAGEARS